MTIGMYFFIKIIITKLHFFQYSKDKKMDLEKITVKYFAENEFFKEPYRATEDSAGYDLFAADTLTLFPKNNGCISLVSRFKTPKGFFGKNFPWSGLLRDHLETCDGGVLDADFRGIVQVIMINHHSEKTFTIRTGDRIAQCVFMKKFNVQFEKVLDMSLLGNRKHGADSFGSTGDITKIIKLDDSDSEIKSDSKNKMQILPKRKVFTQADWNKLVKTGAANQNDLELEIGSERVKIMTDDGKIIIEEKYEQYEN